MWPNSILVLTVFLISSTLVTGGGVKGDKEKGVCPPDNVRCIREEDPLCYSDSDCGDQQICCFWHCGFKCVQPVKDIENTKV
ncbi:WAP four-disulfide core domain protein 12 [Apodemus speciosus]|uniref:WAP four-disulfide core domain protein 12 n=1 Tax=Apodemus speciosus TaxID=105296 RepID=A0ABQ0EJI8_APOSI